MVQGQQAPVLCARQDERADQGAEGGVHQRGLQELLQPGAPPRPAQDRGHLPPRHVHCLPPQVPPEPGKDHLSNSREKIMSSQNFFTKQKVLVKFICPRS